MKKILFLLLLFPFISIYSQNPDINILKDINLNRYRQMDGTFRFISNSVTPVSMCTPVLLLGFGCIIKDSIMRQKALCIGASVITGAIITTVLKHSINRTRPFVTYPYIEHVTEAGSPSFPSGHASDAFAFATSVSLAYPKWYVSIPSYAYAGAVGYSRMHLGVHYPSDVLMGAIIGGGSAYLCYKGQQWLQHKKTKIKN